MRMSKVLIVSLDGATWANLKPLVERGVMPYVAGLIESGSSGVLESVMPPVTAPAWVSFMTGKHPDKHGILDFRHFDPLAKSGYITNASFVKGKTLWQIISGVGKEVIVINVPYTYPVYPINGILISGFDTPWKDAECYYPASMRQEIESSFPAYSPVLPVWSMREVADSCRSIQYIGSLTDCIRLRTQVSLYMLGKYGWDVAMIHYQELDFIQHIMWDRILQALDGNEISEISREVYSFFRVLDNSIQLLASSAAQSADGNMDLFLISDHGFGAHKGVVYPNVALESMRWLRRAEGESGRGSQLLRAVVSKVGKKMTGSKSTTLRQTYYALKGLYYRLSNRIPKTLDDELQQKNSWMREIDWNESRAAMVTGDMCAFIYVQDIADVPACLQQLREITDPHVTGLVFRAVWTFEEAYGRPCEEPYRHFIIALPHEGYSLSTGFGEAIVRQCAFAGDYPGIHRPEGIFVAYGPSIRSGVQARLSLVDIAPTVLHLVGLPIPADIDGRVASAILMVEREPKLIPVSDHVSPSRSQEYSEEETPLIEERLRALGYLK